MRSRPLMSWLPVGLLGALLALMIGGCGASTPGQSSTPAAAAPTPAVAHHYIGPPHHGRSRCGYVAFGTGVAQASAFSVRGTSCATARALAAGAGRARTRHSLQIDGFACQGARRGAGSLLQYRCHRGQATVAFIVG